MDMLVGALFAGVIVVEFYFILQSALSLFGGEYSEVMGFTVDCRARMVQLVPAVGMILVTSPTRAVGGMIVLEGLLLGQALILRSQARDGMHRQLPMFLSAILSIAVVVVAFDLTILSPYK